MLKPRKIKSAAVRDAANGEECTLGILGVCHGRTDTTVLSHLPDEGGIMGGKVDDLSGCFACYACHRVVDGLDRWPVGERPLREWYFRRAMIRTWRRLHELGVLTIKGVK